MPAKMIMRDNWRKFRDTSIDYVKVNLNVTANITILRVKNGSRIAAD